MRVLLLPSSNLQVTYGGKEREFTPEQISAMVLTRMKEIAEAYLGKPVRGLLF